MQQMQQQIQMQQEMQAQQMQQMQQQQQMGATQEEDPQGFQAGADAFEEQNRQDQQQEGVSEIEQGIAELEELLSKGEVDGSSVKSLLSLMNGSLHKIVQASEMKKSEDAKRMNEAKDIFKSAAISQQKDFQEKVRESNSSQKRIVDNILSKWKEEERGTISEIIKTIKVEGKIK